MTPKREEGDGPVLRIGGRSWDLTNLYPNGKVPKELSANAQTLKNTSKRRSKRKKSKPEASLYPSINELDDSSFHFKPAAEVFRRSAVQSNSPKPTSQPGAFHSVPGTNTLSRMSPLSSPRNPVAVPGAFPSSSTLSKPKKPLPPLPSWVESPEKLACKLKCKCFIDEDKSSSSHHRESSQQADVSCVDVYRQESIRSVQSTYSAGPARAEEEQDNNASSTRSQIEVAPGHYMPLRGSAETMAAVESGMARTVICMVCQATLLCVPDAELVVCPDCRLLSPLPADSKACCQTRTSRYESDTHPGVRHEVGGVGLGLKVEANSAYNS